MLPWKQIAFNLLGIVVSVSIAWSVFIGTFGLMMPYDMFSPSAVATCIAIGLFAGSCISVLFMRGHYLLWGIVGGIITSVTFLPLWRDFMRGIPPRWDYYALSNLGLVVGIGAGIVLRRSKVFQRVCKHFES